MLPEDLKGRKFGKLTAVEYMGKSRWRCVCECGGEKITKASSLKTGMTTSCGCIKRKDITGQRFGYLEAIRYDHSGPQGAEWLHHCHRCGKDVVLPTRWLHLYQSCGCLSKSQGKIQEFKKQDLVEGTSLAMVKKKEPNKNNKIGIRGVCQTKEGYYLATITFQGNVYRLKKSYNLEECIKARKKAEEALFGDFLEWYENRQKETDEQDLDVAENDTKK